MKINETDLRKSQFSYFLGKIVTLQTNASALQYDSSEKGFFLHFKTFGGVCEGFDEYGVWLLDRETGAKSFYFYSGIQGIVENPTLEEDHPLVQAAAAKVADQIEQEETIRKGREISEQMGEMKIEDFQKLMSQMPEVVR